jgi:hypothetical protein
MKSINLTIARVSVGAAITALLAACAGTPVSLGSRLRNGVPAGIEGGTERQISAEACGFQLLLLIPIGVNSRAARAYQALEQKAGGDFITDVQVQERWSYGFVGTQYCTVMQAKAIRPKDA